MPHVRQANAILGSATGAVVFSNAGTAKGALHAEHVVLRPANSGFRLYVLPHWEHEMEIIGRT
jgi:hypothetical protein